MQDKATHPSHDQLAAFAEGLLVGQEQAIVEKHVSQCDSCCDVLRRIPHGQLVARMRSADTDGPYGETQTMTGQDAAPRKSAGTSIPQELVDHPRYRIVKRLGAGGMGEVYQAEHRLMERPVALKVINRRLINSEAAIERFRFEVKAAARLSHRNIVTAYDAEQAGELHFLVMEYVPGDDLASVVERRGRLSVLHAANYAMQAAQGLQHALENGMVHRDIKPHNLMRTPKGTIKILDFGLARFANAQREENDNTGLTSAGATVGTPDYIAPEQARDSRNVDIRADIYSLGCTLYYLLGGVVPFPTGTVLEKILAHCEREPAPLGQLRGDLPGDLVRIVERMMAKDPGQRFQKPAEVVEALRPFGKPDATRGDHTMIDARVEADAAPPELQSIAAPARTSADSALTALGQLEASAAALHESQAPRLLGLPPSPAGPRKGTKRRSAAPGNWLSRRHAPIAIGGFVAVLLLVGVLLGPSVYDTFRSLDREPGLPRDVNGSSSSFSSAPGEGSTFENSAARDADRSGAGAAAATPGAALSGAQLFRQSGGDWIDLISRIDPQPAARAGNWRREGGELSVDAAPNARLTLLADPPDQYDFEVHFTRHTGIHSIAIMFPMGLGQATFEVDAWGRGYNLAGIQQIDSRNLMDIPASPTRPLVNERRYSMLLKVRRNSAQAIFDDELIAEYQGDGGNLSLLPLWDLGDSRALGIGAYDSATTFHLIRLRSASGDSQ